jgi:hypothetical protein
MQLAPEQALGAPPALGGVDLPELDPHFFSTK